MPPRLRDIADCRCSKLLVLPACMLAMGEGLASAQDGKGPVELPPIQVVGGEAPRHKSRPAPRQTRGAVVVNGRIVVHRGRFIGVVLTGRPIGELRRAYEALHKAHHELQRAQRQLVEQEKMASLGRLVAGVAHELNNPISFVYGNIHTLTRYRTALVTYLDAIHGNGKAGDPGALKKSLRIEEILADFGPLIEGTMEGAVRISEIVKNLRRLSFSKLGEVERVDLGRLINTAVLWAVRTKQMQVDVRMDIEPELWISGNEGQLHQVIVNVVENAVDAMRGTEFPCLIVSATRKNQDVLVRVSDNGPGIDKDHVNHIFEPFFTTKRVGEGTGLGLWISYGIVREHGGELFAANRPEGGAMFSFALPAV